MAHQQFHLTYRRPYPQQCRRVPLALSPLEIRVVNHQQHRLQYHRPFPRGCHHFLLALNPLESQVIILRSVLLRPPLLTLQVEHRLQVKHHLLVKFHLPSHQPLHLKAQAIRPLIDPLNLLQALQLEAQPTVPLNRPLKGQLNLLQIRQQQIHLQESKSQFHQNCRLLALKHLKP